MSEFEGLTEDAVNVLSGGRPEYRLTGEQLLQLKLHVKMIAGWTERVPQNTRFFFVQWQPILLLPRIEGYSRDELGIAAYLQPLHSQLCAIALQVLWKANQLIRTLCSALDSGDLIVAATMARSLVETAAAFGCESEQINELWKARTLKPAAGVDCLSEFVNRATEVVGQILFGTKIKEDGTPATGIERTNILTLIDKAEKVSAKPGVRILYGLLCDTVHPSIGSNRCFWTTEPDPQAPILEFVTDRRARGEQSDLPFAIGSSSLWALTWLGSMWNMFDRTRKDLCLTAKIYALPEMYYGIVRPGKPTDYCPCGSTQLGAACPHHFGRF